MDSSYYQELSATNFRYSYHHLQMCFHDIREGQLKNATAHLTVGLISAVPLLGAGVLLAGRKYFPQSSFDFVDQRRVKVTNYISQNEFQVMQLYFLAHQMQRENEKVDLGSENVLPRTPAIPASYLDNNLSSLIAFLEEYKNSLPENEQSLFTELLSPLKKIFDIAILISAIDEAPNAEMRSTLERELCELLWQQYQNLPVGGKMLIPAGYLNGSRYDLQRPVGHAVLIEIFKQNENNVELRVFNTGEGVGFHAQTATMRYPFVIANIAPAVVDRGFFEKIIELSGHTTDDAEPHRIDDLYYLLVWKFGFRREYHRPSDGKYFHQGPVAACAQQCFMAWIKSSLTGQQDVFCAFANKFTYARLSKVEKITDRTFWMEQPYVVYSSTLQNSLGSTIFFTTKRLFQGPSVYKKLDSQTVKKITTYISQHTFTPHPTDEQDTCVRHYSSFTGRENDPLPTDYNAMRTLRSCGCLYLSSQSVKNEILALNAADREWVKSLPPAMMRRVISGERSLQDALETNKNMRTLIKENAYFGRFYDLMAYGYLSPQQARLLCQQYDAAKLEPLGRSHFQYLILADKLSVTEFLALRDPAIKRLGQASIYSLVMSGAISVAEVLALRDAEIE
jgi:hypothetical protein